MQSAFELFGSPFFAFFQIGRSFCFCLQLKEARNKAHLITHQESSTLFCETALFKRRSWWWWLDRIIPKAIVTSNKMVRHTVLTQFFIMPFLLRSLVWLVLFRLFSKTIQQQFVISCRRYLTLQKVICTLCVYNKQNHLQGQKICQERAFLCAIHFSARSISRLRSQVALERCEERSGGRCGGVDPNQQHLKRIHFCTFWRESNPTFFTCPSNRHIVCCASFSRVLCTLRCFVIYFMWKKSFKGKHI